MDNRQRHTTPAWRQAGYTLTSVILGMQMSVVAAFIAVPKISSYAANYKLTGAVEQMSFEIARARMQAVGTNRIVRIIMGSNGTQYTRETSTDGSTWTGTVTKTLTKGVTSTTPSAEVRFDKRGFPTVRNNITLQNTLNKTNTISTSAIGRPSIS